MSEEGEKIDSTTQVMNSSIMFIQKIYTDLEKKVEEQQAEIERLKELIDYEKKYPESDRYTLWSESSGSKDPSIEVEESEVIARRRQVAHNDQMIRYHSIIHVKIPTEDLKFYLTYNSICDKYQSSAHEFDGKLDWTSLTYKTSNLIIYRERYDPCCNYIARNELVNYKQAGIAQWRFNLENFENKWSKIELIIHGEVWPGTKIKLSMLGYETKEDDSKSIKKKLLLNSLNVIRRKELKNPMVIEIVCALKGLNVDVKDNPRKHHLYPKLFLNWPENSSTDKDTFDLKIY